MSQVAYYLLARKMKHNTRLRELFLLKNFNVVMLSLLQVFSISSLPPLPLCPPPPRPTSHSPGIYHTIVRVHGVCMYVLTFLLLQVTLKIYLLHEYIIRASNNRMNLSSILFFKNCRK